MNRLLERHPGELMLLAFVLMGLAFMIGVAGGEALSGLGGQGHDGILDGSAWQAGVFPPR